MITDIQTWDTDNIRETIINTCVLYVNATDESHRRMSTIPERSGAPALREAADRWLQEMMELVREYNRRINQIGRQDNANLQG